MDGPYGLKLLPERDYKAYEALGNAVNVKVAMLVANALVGEEKQPRDYIYDTEQLTMSIEMLSRKRKMAQSEYVDN